MMYSDVSKFLKKMNIKTNKSPTLLTDDNVKMRYRHLLEETEELITAHNDQDIEGCVDALIDVVYVALGTAKMMGLSTKQWEKCFNRVHSANMLKYPGDVTDHKVGVKKPVGWKPPTFKDIL